MDFSSDNASGTPPEILAALAEANTGTAHSYGDDAWTKKLHAGFSALFERDVTVLPVFTGTAANGLALATLTPPWGAVLCHADAHINTDECGAPEGFTGGAKLIPVQGDGAKMTVTTLEQALAGVVDRGVHSVKPTTLSLTQATEFGLVYSPAEVAELTDVACKRKMRVHVDGARFANAIASLKCSPAAATWKAGVDLLAFGGTKNGAIGAEALICFDPTLGEELELRRKRSGHLASKMRFISAQLLALLNEGLWLKLAETANTRARRLSSGLVAAGVKLAHPTEANEVFVWLPVKQVEALHAAGAHFYPWTGISENGLLLCRLVTSFATTDAEIDSLLRVQASFPDTAGKSSPAPGRR